jgi:comEA protein
VRKISSHPHTTGKWRVLFNIRPQEFLGSSGNLLAQWPIVPAVFTSPCARPNASEARSPERFNTQRCQDDEEDEMMMRILMAAILGIAVSAAAASAQNKSTPKAATAATATAAAPVNLNTATAEQLATIPGVGPKMAERIVDYRQKNGGFKKVEDLMNVSGVGEKSFLKMKPLITVGAPKSGQ